MLPDFREPEVSLVILGSAESHASAGGPGRRGEERI